MTMEGKPLPIFLREKKNKGHRLIPNLKEFNKNVVYHHFKMDNLSTAINMVRNNCLMTFVFQMVLHFAPRMFTKLLQLVFSHLRKLGMKLPG